MRIGQVFRYATKKNKDRARDQNVDGYSNYYYYTHSSNTNTQALLERGINPTRITKAVDGKRRPIISISSSPHKIGTMENPWQDFFDPDNGYIHFYGDNKNPEKKPETVLGNKALLDQFNLHSSPDREKRLMACPILFWERVNIGGKNKGYVKFQGYGVIEKVQLVTQFESKKQYSFTNYVFDFVVFSLTSENEKFNWEWISTRRDPKKGVEQCLEIAPSSWRKWVREGRKSLEKCRRRVVKLQIVKKNAQITKENSSELKALKEIYRFYSGKNRKARFESLAAIIAARIIQGDGYKYKMGWITPSTRDHGADFIGRLDIGTDLAQVKLIVLGQAKCEKMETPTNANHIARTVARLRRGYIGIYVTTSYFSEAVQREVLEDKYPIILVNGLRVAEEVLKIVYKDGYLNVEDFLLEVDRTHDENVERRDPEEILYE